MISSSSSYLQVLLADIYNIRLDTTSERAVGVLGRVDDRDHTDRRTITVRHHGERVLAGEQCSPDLEYATAKVNALFRYL